MAKIEFKEEFDGRNLADIKPFDCELVEVAQWTPGLHGQGKPTQVHLMLKIKNGPHLVVRFKGPDTLKVVANTLLKYAEEIWGSVDS